MLLVFMMMITCCIAKAGPGDPDPDGDPDLPLDPGSWVLVAAGVGYGVKKWRDSKQNTAKKIKENDTVFLHDDINQNHL